MAFLTAPVPIRYGFAFAASYVVPAAAFGITPLTAYAVVGPDDLHVRFGLWRLRTPLANLRLVQLTGDFGYLKTAGPAHLSFADRGVSFATNGDAAVCVQFHEPVKVLDPTGRLRHPGATLTVAEPEALAQHLRERMAFVQGRTAVP